MKNHDKMRSVLAFIPAETVTNHNELANLRAALMHEQDITKACETASGWTADNEPLPMFIARLRKERDEAMAKCAEMRAVLEHWIRYNQADIPKNADEGEAAGEDFTAVWSETEHALSTDCGKGWIRSTELDATIELEDRLLTLGANCRLKDIAADRARLEALRKGAE